ncbi:hypothetical protein BpHYR1_052742 [Brachionus plicatilis]|uniref:Uncharacterized protein n=1 Tax=Brachionus plicatilis TaxID=10195 RepID=A0A3M7PT33_BRAPC|nr:hypothetical protein BpHYR1_052742 [Brachionus plicatilis]
MVIKGFLRIDKEMLSLKFNLNRFSSSSFFPFRPRPLFNPLFVVDADPCPLFMQFKTSKFDAIQGLLVLACVSCFIYKIFTKINKHKHSMFKFV